MAEVFLVEAVEDDRLVDTVEELRREVAPQVAHEAIADLGDIALVGQGAQAR